MSDTLKHELIRACRHLLRPVISFMLRNGMNWKEFSEISKGVFVNVAADEYGVHGRPTNNSRIAILVGLSRRDVKKYSDLAELEDPNAGSQRHPATRVLSGWYQDEQFTDADGLPMDLPYDGSEISFVSLVKKFGGDIPPGAMLTELQRVGAAERLKCKKLRALNRNYIPEGFSEENIRMLGDAVHDLASTINYNLNGDGSQPPRLRRVVENLHIRPDAVACFHALAADEGQKLLEKLDDWLSDHETDNTNDSNNNGMRTGVGIYFFQDDIKRGIRS